VSDREVSRPDEVETKKEAENNHWERHSLCVCFFFGGGGLSDLYSRVEQCCLWRIAREESWMLHLRDE
jgi:hypothetical protein